MEGNHRDSPAAHKNNKKAVQLLSVIIYNM